MLFLLKVFFKDPWIVVPVILSATGQLFMWPYIIVNLSAAGEQAFLHYNNIFGIDLVGAWWKALFLPLGGLILILINYSLAFYCYNSDKIMARILSICAGLFQLFLVLAVYLMVEINL